MNGESIEEISVDELWVREQVEECLRRLFSSIEVSSNGDDDVTDN